LPDKHFTDSISKNYHTKSRRAGWGQAEGSEAGGSPDAKVGTAKHENILIDEFALFQLLFSGQEFQALLPSLLVPVHVLQEE